jgi:hypothetical protein
MALGADDVAVARHRPDGRVIGHQAAGRGQVAHHGHAIEGVLDAAADLGRRAHQVDGPGRAGRQWGPARAVHLPRGTADQQPGPPAVLVLEHLERAHGIGGRRDRDRVGDRAERGSQGGLAARVDGQQSRHRAEHARQS